MSFKAFFKNIQASIAESMQSPQIRLGVIKQLLKPHLQKFRSICLDVGCGTGQVSHVFKGDFSVVINLDVDKGNILKAVCSNRQSHLSRNHFIIADAEHLPFKHEAISTIFSFSLIEHLKNKESFIREIWRVLRFDGYFFMQFPSKDFFIELHSGIPFPKFCPHFMLDFYYQKLLGEQGEFPVWNLDMKTARKLCKPYFKESAVLRCNYEETCVPKQARAFYSLLKGIGILNAFPLGWLFIAKKG